jgi:methylenetetrahydrofolate reductase (NADPH)
MKIRDILSDSHTGVSFEVFPPKTEKGMANLQVCVDEFVRWKPSFVSVTYGAGGSNRDNAIETVVSLKKRDDVEVLAHLTCIGASKSEIRSIMEIYKRNGIENILALRGDPPKDVVDFDWSNGEFRNAREMVEFIKKEHDFCVGVAVYPEGHSESPTIEKDMEYMKQKIDAGADFAITQMFFENSHFYSFLERCQKAGIKIPIIAGIMPILNYERIVEFASFCRAEIPENLKHLMEPLKGNPDDMKKAGIEFAVRQCLDLKKHGVERFHFFTLNKYISVNGILKNLFNEI